MRKFYIYTNEIKDPEGEIEKRVKDYLLTNGAEVFDNPGLGAECILVLGGDGTLISAAGEYAVMVVVMFLEAIKGDVYPYKWMCIINPAFFMIVCILLSKILPQTAFVNGVFDLGQQSVGLFIVFITLYFTCKNRSSIYSSN